MKYSITIYSDSKDELLADVERLVGAKAAAKDKYAAPATVAKTAEEPATPPAPIVEKPKGPTREQVKDALKGYAALNGKDAAIGILRDVGKASSIGELAEENFQAVLDKANA